MLKRLACLSLIGLSALGCSKETTSSENIKTGGIAALIDVYADGASKARVHVELRVGGSSSNAYVDLEGGDKLIATADGDSKTLQAVDTGIYEGEFTGVGEDTEFSVTLERPDDTTASDNSGSLPAPFDLVAPADDLSREKDELEVTWDPGSGDSMELEFEGDCIFDYQKGVPDEGSYRVRPDTLNSTGGNEPEACDVELTAVRTRAGVADGKFDRESWFRLHQRRRVKFVSNP